MEAQQQQQQQQQYEYHQTYNPSSSLTTTTTTTTTPQIQQQYDPQSYYASYYQQQQQQPYQTPVDYSSSSSYYYPDYSASAASYPTTLDPNSVHPPGVPLSVDPHHSHVLVPVPQNLYYHSPGFVQPGQPVYGVGSNQAGRPIRGGSRGTFGRHGRGRGGGRGKHVSPQTSAPAATNVAEVPQSSVQSQAAPSKPPPQMAWCELCRVDCNTLDILEKHKNGKKHQRNLKVFEEMQSLSKHVTVINPQPEGAEAPPVSDVSDKTVLSVAQPSEVAVRGDSSGGRGGLKRKMKAGRGGKWVRAPDGSKRLVEPPKPQVVHLLCELCNVKCESQVVYESHLAGKKHLSNLKRYQGHKETFGEGVQALYPTIPNLSSTAVAPQPDQDAQALASMLLSNQNLPDPQAAQAALAQLLTEHGVHDAQTLMVQLIPYLLTQVQVPVQGSLPVAGLGTNPADPQNQPLQFSTGDAGQNGGQNGDVTTEQQNLPSSVGSEAGVGANDKPEAGTSEAGKDKPE